MIAHIASANETRGRVLLRVLRDPTEAAVHAALRLARAYEAEVETLVIEDEAIFTLTDYPFAREISPAGRFTRPLTAAELSREYDGLRRRVAALVARLAEKTAQTDTADALRLRTRSMRGAPDHMLQIACTENGPWNVVVLGEAADLDTVRRIDDLMRSILDVTGIVATGPGAVRTTGATVAVVEDREQLFAFAQFAQRLSTGQAGQSERIILLPAAESVENGRRLDGELRLALADMPEFGDQIGVAGIEVTRADPSQLAARLIGLRPGFVIMAAHSIIARDPGGLSQFLGAIRCPVLLARDS